MLNICLITIGSELLKGRIINTNAAKIGEMLRPQGFKLAKTVVIPDTPTAIREAVIAEMATHDVVLTSGGLGPTNDDMTKHVLAEIFDAKLILHAPTLTHISSIFNKRGRPLTPRNREQAYLPDSCEVIPNPRGTAPGMLFRERNKWLIAMPGVPFEMIFMMEQQVLPRLSETRKRGFFEYKILRLSHVPESHAADRMATIETSIPEVVQIAYLPRIDGLWLELFIEVEDYNSHVSREQAQTLLEETSQIVYKLFEDKWYAWGDRPLSAILAEILSHKKLTLSVAESLTGGQIMSSIVAISGASNYFKGGITAYDVEIKKQVLGVSPYDIEQHTVVSQQVVCQMAQKIRSIMKADIGISTSGYAEYEGEILPQAWIGYSDGNKTCAEHVYLHGDRNVVIGRAVNHALIFCLRQIRDYKNL